ncbi:hypothetical protein BH18ACT7_BH18ACT7_21040 [soil metagenome]
MGVPRRAVRQILLGLIPLVVIAVVSLILLALRLGEARAPLRTATETATAEVVSTGLGADGRQVGVEYTDVDGELQTARLTLDRAADIPLGAQLDEVAYDPERPGVVYVQGDAVTSTVADLFNGLLIVALVLLVTVVVTILRLGGRRRLAAREPRQLRAHREKYRRGIADRSWLVVQSGESRSWVPVYWDPALEEIGESPTLVTVYGDPEGDKLLGFEVAGEPIWPSGRRRSAPPKGRERDLEATTGGVSLLRQTRTDLVGVFAAPLIGILWAYIDGSGPAGFVFATAVAAGVLFWLPSAYGSDPT